MEIQRVETKTKLIIPCLRLRHFAVRASLQRLDPSPLDLAAVEPHQFGRAWRIDQSRRRPTPASSRRFPRMELAAKETEVVK